MSHVLLDFETRSRADLRVVGGRNYNAHASTEILCCVLYDTDTGEIEIWERGQPRPEMLGAYTYLGAHNMMGFDRFALHALGWSPPEFDDRLIDTSELARVAGLPGSLDALAQRWLGLEKDKVASRFTVGLSSVRRPSGKRADAITPDDWRALSAAEKRERGVLPECGPAELARVVEYCVSDVEILAHGWPALADWQDLEPDVSRVDRVINDRGVQFDVQLATRLLEEDVRATEEHMAAAGEYLGMTPANVRKVASSPAMFGEFTGKCDATKETVAAIIAANIEPKSICMAHARRALASIARGKLDAGLARVSPDGRLRDSHRYYGAHTGRWSGRGMQLQNMPRPAKRFEDWGDAEICQRADEVLAGAHCDAEEIDLLLRACIHAKPGHVLVVEDFSGIEARALAWAAGDAAALAVLQSDLSPYKVMAGAIFGDDPRSIGKGDPKYTIGKNAELGAQYGLGAAKFFENYHVDLAKLGDAHALAERTIAAWRKLHAPIVSFWYACDAAFAAAASGRETSVSCFRFVSAADGKSVAVVLPSGRPIVYNETKVGRDRKGRPRVSYQGHHSREDLYGGKIVENLIQAMCRDLLAGAMVAAESAGLEPVLHVHDEIVCEVPAIAEREARAALHEIMTTVPDWARGFPLGAAGHFGRRYRK